MRTELLHKSADAQSSLKKASAPTIPLRSRGMPRKMTDTTPLKGIPSRVPTSGFRSPSINAANAQRPNLSRTPAGRKDGGIKLIELSEQPLGYAAAKKRKREQQLEEQARKQEQKAAAAAAAAANATVGSTSPSTANNSVQGGKEANTPTTPSSANNSFEIKTETNLNQSQNSSADEGHASDSKEDIKPIINNTENTAKEEEKQTPEYAPPSLSYTQNTPAGILDTVKNSQAEDTKPNAQTLIKTLLPIQSPEKSTKILQTHQQQQQQQQTTINNNNNLNHVNKRIKQEIKIESEEILVPANIKVEKIEQPTITQHSQTQTLGHRIQQQQQQQQQLSQPTQQRVIIQQQPLPTLHQIQTSTSQQQQQTTTQHVIIRTSPQQQQKQTLTVRQQNTPTTPIKMEKLEIKPLIRTTTAQPGTIITQQQPMRPTANSASTNPLANLPNNISVKITSTKTGKVTQAPQQQQQPILINSSTPVILASTPSQTAALRQKQFATATASTQNATPQTAQAIKSMPLSQLKNATNSGPVIISQTIIQPAKRAQQQQQQQQASQQQSPQQQQKTHIIQQQQQQQQPQPTTTTTQYILTQQQQQPQTVPTLTTFTPNRQHQTSYQTSSSTPQTPTSTKILLKTSPSSSVVIRQQQQQQPQQQTITVSGGGGNPPPLIASSSSTSTTTQPTLLNIQNVQLPNRPVTIQPASQAAQQQHLQAQLQQQQQHTLVSNNTATQQPKLTQVLVQPSSSSNANTVSTTGNANVKNKTIILTQKGVILRNIGGDMYQQIPISNVGGLQTLGTGATTLMTTAAGPPGLVKTTSATTIQPTQSITLQQQQGSQASKQLTTIIPQQQHLIVQQQPQATTSLISNVSGQNKHKMKFVLNRFFYI